MFIIIYRFLIFSRTIHDPALPTPPRPRPQLTHSNSSLFKASKPRQMRLKIGDQRTHGRSMCSLQVMILIVILGGNKVPSTKFDFSDDGSNLTDGEIEEILLRDACRPGNLKPLLDMFHNIPVALLFSCYDDH